MSRHNIRLMYAGQQVLVVAGYDRPLRELFLQVFRCQESVLAGEDEIVYDSLHEPALDWTIISTLTGKLDALGINHDRSCLSGPALHCGQYCGLAPCQSLAG